MDLVNHSSTMVFQQTQIERTRETTRNICNKIIQITVILNIYIILIQCLTMRDKVIPTSWNKILKTSRDCKNDPLYSKV